MILFGCCLLTSVLVLLYAEAKGNNSFTRALRAAVELRLPSGAINKAVLSPVRIESALRFQSTGACHLKTEKPKRGILCPFFDEIVFVFAICFAPNSWEPFWSAPAIADQLFPGGCGALPFLRTNRCPLVYVATRNVCDRKYSFHRPCGVRFGRPNRY